MRLGVVLLVLAACTGNSGGQVGDDVDDDNGDDNGGGRADAGPVVDAGPGAIDADVGEADPVGEPGPFDVLEKTVSADGVAATVYAPSEDGGATIAAGRHALVIVSPGFQLQRAEYAQKSRHLASWGFVAIAQDFGGGFSPDHMAYAEQVSAVIDWALGAGSGLAANLDPERLAAAGHSMGGKVSMLAAALDSRIGAVVGWDPVDAKPPTGGGISVTPEMMGGIAAKVAVLGETLDGAGGMPCAPTADNYAAYFDAAKPPALEITVVGADHMDWAEDGGGLPGLFCQKGTAEPDAILAMTNRTTVAWLRRHLDGDTSMDVYLTGAALAADVASGAVTTRHK